MGINIQAEAEYIANLIIRGENAPMGYSGTLGNVHPILMALQDKGIDIWKHDKWLTDNNFWEDVI
jgi:hypothetical protein